MKPFEDNKELYNKLNNYIPTDEIIENVKRYASTGQFPEYVDTTAKKKRYAVKYKDFNVNENDELVFTPLGLIVVPKAEANAVLKNIYAGDKNAGLGKAILALYMYVRDRYVNITRAQVRQFIMGQTNYQLTKDFKHRVNKPIVAKHPNEIWCMDLVDMNFYVRNNRGWRYILVVVDVFSRKIWLERLKNKDGTTVSESLLSIFQRADVALRHIISDNGPEFIGEEMVNILRDNDVKQRLTRTYAPQANAICERANREVRKIIRAYMAKNKNKMWFSLLPDVEENKNNTYHSLIKTYSDNIWTNSREPIKLRDDLPVEELRLNRKKSKRIMQIKARNNVLKKVKTDIKRFKDKELEVGDFVRIKMTAISSNLRAIEKEQKTKQIVIRYTPTIFRIKKKITPRKGLLERSRYIVEDLNGRVLYVKRLTNRAGDSDKFTPKQFYTSDLLLIPNSINDTTLTLEQAIKLSGVEPNQNDLTFNDPEEEAEHRVVAPRNRPIGRQENEEVDDDDYLPRYSLRNVNYEPNYWQRDLTEEEYALDRQRRNLIP